MGALQAASGLGSGIRTVDFPLGGKIGCQTSGFIDAHRSQPAGTMPIAKHVPTYSAKLWAKTVL